MTDTTAQGSAAGFLAFLRFALGAVLRGNRGYWVWLGVLAVLALAGLASVGRQLYFGLAVTHLSDHVNWGLYISNFMFVGGVAASALIFVVAVSLYGRDSVRPALPAGIALALAAVIMGALFVQVDLGRPDRAWHLLPVIGVFYWPHSMLAWDVLAVNVYLVLSVALALWLPYGQFRGRDAARPIPGWLGLLCIAAILFLLVVEGFLFSGYTARPLWNTAVLVPRFLAAAFIAGPALLVLLLQVTDRVAARTTLPGALDLLVRTLRVAVWAHVLLFGVEAFVHLYSPNEHGLAFHYQFFGLDGQNRMVPWNWTGLVLILFAMAVLSVPDWNRRRVWLNLACGAAALSAWIDKGMGLIWPGFVPSPMGEVVEYLPSWDEVLTSVGIVALGLIVFTISVNVSLEAAGGRGGGR